MSMRMFSLMIVAGLIAAGVLITLRGLMKLDRDHDMEISAKEWSMLMAGSLITACIWTVMTDGEAAAVKIAWLVIHIYFLSCMLTGSMTCQVYDIFQYPGVVAAGFIVLYKQGSMAVGISLLLFAMLQYVIFMRLYGAADGMAFLVAALAEGSLCYDINIYLFHMIMSYLMLALVQVWRGNVGMKGRLKKPVPFVPYIAVSFWMILVLGERINICI